MRKSLRFTSTITHERGTYERTRKSKTRYCLVKSGLTGRTRDCYTDCAAHFIAPLAKSSSGYWSDKCRIRKGHCFRSFSQPRSGLSGWAISGTEGAGRLCRRKSLSSSARLSNISSISDDSDDPDLRRDAQSRSPKTSAWHSFRNFAGMGVAHLELAFLSAASEVLAFIARHSSISARRNSGSSCDKWPCSATSRQSVSVIAWFWYWVSCASIPLHKEDCGRLATSDSHSAFRVLSDMGNLYPCVMACANASTSLTGIFRVTVLCSVPKRIDQISE